MNKKRLLVFLLGLIILSFNVEAARLESSDITYLGAFRVPEYSGSANDYNRWAWGSFGLGYYPHGDSSGSGDGHPGSLFGSGHDGGGGTSGNKVAELSIPAPVISASKNLAELPLATTLHSFVDVTGGIKNSIESSNQRFGDILYLPQQAGQSSAKLYWTVFDYYNVNNHDDPQHGWSNVNLDSPNAQGPWHVGESNQESSPPSDWPTHASKTADYLLEIPVDWANTYVQGKTLGTGRGDREAGTNGASAGPTLYATAPWEDNGGNAPTGQDIDTIPLLYYDYLSHPFPGYSQTDYWSDAVWVDVDDKEAFLVFGNKCTSTSHYDDFDNGGYCGENKGWVCDGPYQAQILLYDTNDLAQVAQGSKQPWEPSPYATVDLTNYIWPQCQTAIAAVGYDIENGYIYVFQKGIDTYTTDDVNQANPIVHVFSVGEGVNNPPAQDTTPPTISNVASNSITNTSAIISWNTNEASTGYVKYGTTSGTYNFATSRTSSSLTHARNLTNLNPSTTYYYVINASDASGNVRISNQYSFTTTNTSVPINVSNNSTSTPPEDDGNDNSGGGSPLVFKGGGSSGGSSGAPQAGNDNDENTQEQEQIRINLINNNFASYTLGIGVYEFDLSENETYEFNLKSIRSNQVSLSINDIEMVINLGAKQNLYTEEYNVEIGFQEIVGNKAKITITKSPITIINYNEYGYVVIIGIVLFLIVTAFGISHLSRKN